MTVDYGSEGRIREFGSPLSFVSCVQLRGGRAKLFNLRVNLLNLREMAYAMPQHRPKQHVVCVHHNIRPIQFDRHLDGRNKRETTAKGDIAFQPANVPTRLRPATDDRHRVLSF
jgi:hypothetical protein